MALRSLPNRAMTLPGRLREDPTLQYAAVAAVVGAAGTVASIRAAQGSGTLLSLQAGILFGLLVGDRADVAFDRLAAWVGLLAASPIFFVGIGMVQILAELPAETLPFAAVFSFVGFAAVSTILGAFMAAFGVIGGRLGAWLGDALVRLRGRQRPAPASETRETSPHR